MSAARLPEIVSGLDLDADAHTFEDLLENEDWWAPYRSEFPLSGRGHARTARSRLLGARAIGAISAARRWCARRARPASRRASRRSRARAFLFAAARVPRGKHRVGRGRDRRDAVRTPGAADGRGRRGDGRRAVRRQAAARRPPVPTPRRRSWRRWSAAKTGRPERASSTLDDGRLGLAVALDRGLWLRRRAADGPAARGLAARPGHRRGAALLLGGVGPRRPARRAGGAAQVDGDGPMAITQPTGSGQRRRPASSRDRTRRRSASRRRRRGRPPTRASGGASGAAAAAAMLETPPAGPGVTLGRYRLLERIGEGGMAEIFIAAAHGAEGFVRNFVVKRMHPHLARSRDAVNQFIDEGRLQSGARALEHRPGVRLRARRRGVLPRARVHPRARSRAAGAPARREVRPLAQRAGRVLHHARGAGGARLRARAHRRRRARAWASFTATSRRATSWCRRAAR